MRIKVGQKKYDKAFSYLSFDPSSYLKYLSEEGKKNEKKRINLLIIR